MMTAQAAAFRERHNLTRLVLLGAVLVAGAMRWHGAVLEPYVKPDETVYVSAAQLWSAGRSPYEESIFFYTPVFAWTAAELTERFGSLGYLQIQRASNLLGICVATWLAVLIARWRSWPALVVSVLWVCLAPAAALSIEIGNATGVPTALTLTGLWLWRRRPNLAGFSLGLAQAIKPIAPLAALCLLAHRKSSNPRRSLRAGLVSIAVSALLLLVGLRFLPGILDNATGSGNPYNFSLQHLLAGLGLYVRPVWVTALIGAGGLWWIGRQRLSKSELLVVVLTVSLLAAPILWAHSLLLFLPVQLLAAARMTRSLRSMRSIRSVPPPSPWLAALPHILAGLALVSTVFSASIGGLAAAPGWLQTLVLAVPYLSLLYLGLYVLEESRSESGAGQPRASQPA